MEPDLTMVGNLPLPKRLLKLIETGRWPRTHEEELHQNIRPLVSMERVQVFAPECDQIYFVRPPFSTVASLIANGHTFESSFCVLDQITPDLSILIGDFGPGSDSPILLDYRQDAAKPSVIRLKLNPIRDSSPGGRQKVLGWRNAWLPCADSFEAFADMLGLDDGV